MQKTTIQKLGIGLGTALAILSLTAAQAGALSAKPGVQAKAVASPAGEKVKQNLINRANSEIDRRLSTLNKLNAKIASTTKLSDSDKASLTQVVNNEIANLTALKTKIDADTDEATAKADVQSIITDYRVYAVVVPQVYLVKTADDQQAAEAKLTALATKLQSRLTGTKNTTAAQAALTDMNAKLAAATGISSSVETGALGLQPADYNSNHGLLANDRTQLKTAQSDIQAAISDAKSIITGLKTQ